jgi:histidinol-phosphate aminotransferase
MAKALQARDAVQRMTAYAPPTGGRAGKLRLDFNENTVGCSPKVMAFLREKLNAESLAIYPEYTAARAELAAYFGVNEPELLLTNGTDEAIQILINTYVDAGDEVIIPQPSYAMYRFYAELAGARIRELQYRPGTLEFPLPELLEMVSQRTRVILISNPNNPTGTAIALEAIEQIAGRAPASAILIDEAYYEFCGVTALPLLARFPNLFVSRTFSKAHGMAGMRLGCLFSEEQNLNLVHKAQSPYSVNMLAALAARAAISDPAYLERYVAEILAARERLCAGLTSLGIPFHGSAGNFILIQFGERASEVKDALGAAGVLVRDRSHEMAGAIRVTVGTHPQVERFLHELERIWRSTHA